MLISEDPDKLKLGDRHIEIVIEFNYDIFLELVKRLFFIKIFCHEILQGCRNNEVLLFEAVCRLELLQWGFVKDGNGLWLPHTDASWLTASGRGNWQVIGYGIIWALSKLFFSLSFDFVRLAIVTSQSHEVMDS